MHDLWVLVPLELRKHCHEEPSNTALRTAFRTGKPLHDPAFTGDWSPPMKLAQSTLAFAGGVLQVQWHWPLWEEAGVCAWGPSGRNDSHKAIDNCHIPYWEYSRIWYIWP